MGTGTGTQRCISRHCVVWNVSLLLHGRRDGFGNMHHESIFQSGGILLDPEGLRYTRGAHIAAGRHRRLRRIELSFCGGSAKIRTNSRETTYNNA